MVMFSIGLTGAYVFGFAGLVADSLFGQASISSSLEPVFVIYVAALALFLVVWVFCGWCEEDYCEWLKKSLLYRDAAEKLKGDVA